ncbi:MAG TPA: inorganic phosphate transporter [Nitrososphaerales archaeon]|nr:inorganic phosphate transporter [Nitrososphaerales archaeon]
MAESLLLLAAVLSFVFGWNNSSFLIGNVRGSGALSLRGALAVTVIGLLAGVLFEGQKMLRSLDGDLAAAVSAQGMAVTFVVSIAITVAMTFADLPASFSATMVGAFLGVALALGSRIYLGQTYLVVAFWFVAPLLSGLAAFLIHRSIRHAESRLGLVAVDSMNRWGTVLGSLATAYALGANNIGLILGSALNGSQASDFSVLALGLTLAALAGTLLLGRGGVSGTIGDRLLVLTPQGVISVFVSSALLVWLGTQLRVPVSISQCILGGMLGAALSQNVAVINRRLMIESIGSWVVVPALALVASYLLMAA